MIHKWNPSLSGDIAITIKANGDWYHEGVKFTRQPLVKLFSSILKKEGDDYFLVSPVEKWKITVEDAPLLVIEMDVVKSLMDDHLQIIKFKTSTDDVFSLDQFHRLKLSANRNTLESRPYVLVRDKLEALIHRNVFYQLAEMSVMYDEKCGVWSSGLFFPLE